MSTALGSTEEYALLEESLIATTLEAFRMHRTFKQVLGKLETRDSQRFLGKADYFLARISRNLENAGMSIGSLREGDQYDPGMPVTVLNLDSFDPDVDRLVIEQVLEPIILNSNGVRRVGAVLVREES
jgi:hypothetical protein